MRAALAALGGLTLAATLSCVSQEHSDVREAQRAYDQCVAEQATSQSDCEPLQERVRAAERRYESNAQGAWGCNPAQAECPTPR
jgi:hypothetical protein